MQMLDRSVALLYMCAIRLFLFAGPAFDKGPGEISSFECTDWTLGGVKSWVR